MLTQIPGFSFLQVDLPVVLKVLARFDVNLLLKIIQEHGKKPVNAYCSDPIQIFEVKGDSIFVLTQSEIKPVKLNERFKIQSVAYSIELYKVDKRPKKEHQYFLDSECKK